jgi:hypothetical protein
MSRVFILSEPTGPRLSVALAAEIGLKESIILLQMEYWISQAGHIRDGKKWTYQSLESLKTQFPFMSKSTINRIIDRLEALALLHVTDRYNKRAGDKTRWFALNEEGCNKLESIKILKVKTTLNQNGKTLYQNEPTLYQNETTLPNDLTNENTITSNVWGDAGDTPVLTDDEQLFDDWVDEAFEVIDPQPFLSTSFLPKEKTHQPYAEPIPKSAHTLMYRLCYRAETDAEQLMLSSTQRGKVASILGQLQKANANLAHINTFEAWWVNNWRSKDRVSGQYQPPRPDQVAEHWNEAMKSGVKPIKPPESKPKHEIADLTTVMRKHRAS